MSIFTGAGVAIVTPMKENGDVNFEKLGEILEEQIAEGTDAIVICGTTGESATLSHEEHLAAIKYTIEKVNKRIPVIAGTGSNCTETFLTSAEVAPALSQLSSLPGFPQSRICPTSPALKCLPLTSLPSMTMAPPIPVPRVMRQKSRQPFAAPASISPSAAQLLSFSTTTRFPVKSSSSFFRL